MGCSPSADLVWGIPVLAYDEDTGEATQWWDEDREDWREFPDSELTIVHYGHYEDPDNQRGILTSTRVEKYWADAWDPVRVTPIDLATQMTNDKLYSKSEDQARYLNLGVSFYADARWWLVASYG